MIKKTLLIVVGLVLIASWPTVRVARWWRAYTFDQECASYLRLTADASTVASADQLLSHAIGYLDNKGITHGNTDLFMPKPTNDVGIWYRNLVAARDELRSAKESDSTAQTNLLLKLRETLTDSTGQGTVLSLPDRVAFCPHPQTWTAYSWLSWSGLVLGLGSIGWGFLSKKQNS